MSDGVRVGRSLVIPWQELEFRYTTSGGPGGQHANKSSTRVELLWNVASSAVLGPRQRDRIRGHLRHRIDSSGTLRLVGDARRSQLHNKEAVVERLAELVGEALRPRKKRIATAPTSAARERRLEQKKQRSEIKRLRRAPRP